MDRRYFTSIRRLNMNGMRGILDRFAEDFVVTKFPLHPLSVMA